MTLQHTCFILHSFLIASQRQTIDKQQQQYIQDIYLQWVKSSPLITKINDFHKKNITYSTLPVKLIPAKWGDFVMLSPNVCPDDGRKFTTPKRNKTKNKKVTKTRDWQNCNSIQNQATRIKELVLNNTS